MIGSSAVQTSGNLPAVLGIPVELILFALTLVGVALFHRHTLQVALTGLAAIVATACLLRSCSAAVLTARLS